MACPYTLEENASTFAGACTMCAMQRALVPLTPPPSYQHTRFFASHCAGGRMAGFAQDALGVGCCRASWWCSVHIADLRWHC